MSSLSWCSACLLLWRLIANQIIINIPGGKQKHQRSVASCICVYGGTAAVLNKEDRQPNPNGAALAVIQQRQNSRRYVPRGQGGSRRSPCDTRTVVSLPRVKPQQPPWVYSDLDRFNHWHRSKLTCVRLSGMGDGMPPSLFPPPSQA